MTQFRDMRGLQWTAATEEVASDLQQAIRHFLTYRSDTIARVDAVLAVDPDCPGAVILKGFAFLFARSLSLVPQAREAHDALVCLAGRANDREKLYTRALGFWTRGDMKAAHQVLDRIVTDYPLDVLALRLQHVNAIFFGRPDVLRMSIMRSLGDWDDDVPGAGFVYGMACMGLEEAGEYARAERLGRRGMELEPDDLWSLHSVAHVMEAEGRLGEGVALMQRDDAYWRSRGPMRHHLWWHEALFLFEAGEFESLLDYYDQRLAPAEGAGYLEMANCASLLFRLEATGQDCGDRWEKLVAACGHLAQDRALTFSDVHMIIALTVAGKGAALDRMARDLADYAEPAGTFDQEAAARISVPLAQAMQSRRAGEFGHATQILLDARFEFPHMGGSIAQRDMLDILLIDTAIAADQKRLARRLLSEYRDARPHSVPMRALSSALAG